MLILYLRKTNPDNILFNSRALCGYMNIPPLMNTCSTGALTAVSDFNATLSSLDTATDYSTRPKQGE